LRDRGPTEVGAFGISHPEDLLLVDDLRLVRQCCSAISVLFDDLAVAEFFDQQVDEGRSPRQFGRIWIHTHPGDCPLPSGTDESTFDRVFGKVEWALMFILARAGQSYAQLRFNVGPSGEAELPTSVDFAQPFAGSSFDAWEAEYLSSVEQQPTLRTAKRLAESEFGWPIIDFEPWSINEHHD